MDTKTGILKVETFPEINSEMINMLGAFSNFHNKLMPEIISFFVKKYGDVPNYIAKTKNFFVKDVEIAITSAEENLLKLIYKHFKFDVETDDCKIVY